MRRNFASPTVEICDEVECGRGAKLSGGVKAGQPWMTQTLLQHPVRSVKSLCQDLFWIYGPHDMRSVTRDELDSISGTTRPSAPTFTNCRVMHVDLDDRCSATFL